MVGYPGTEPLGKRPMTRKRRRLYTLLIGILFFAAAGALVMLALRGNIVFFHSPTDVLERDMPPDRRFRLGGLVEEGSVVRLKDGVSVTFRVTDLENALPVVYRGILPDLFREGQGVIAEGVLDAEGVFQASEVLAKHDENYMPPEVAEALKKSGRWQAYAGEEGYGGGDPPQ